MYPCTLYGGYNIVWIHGIKTISIYFTLILLSPFSFRNSATLKGPVRFLEKWLCATHQNKTLLGKGSSLEESWSPLHRSLSPENKKREWVKVCALWSYCNIIICSSSLANICSKQDLWNEELTLCAFLKISRKCCSVKHTHHSFSANYHILLKTNY